MILTTILLMSAAGGAVGATRDAGTIARTPVRAATPVIQRANTVTSRGTTQSGRAKSTKSRTATSLVSRNATATPASQRTNTQTSPTGQPGVISRATTMAETRTGLDYERCKTAYFTCMDQFCSLKNDDYRRCSCSNRVTDLTAQRQVLQDAGQQLTVFTENLDVVGMTAAQASAMRTASEGENALTSDTSASKALLQAIMNSIRGGDTNVGGKYSDLNSISISFDTSNAFGVTDSGQLIASYNAQNLYNAVYPQCRNAVRADCTDAALQRAITAYLMAIEQDCNTVQTAIAETRSQMKAAVREGGAMLDLARVENRQKHNSDDIATCLANVETAILSEEVCGTGYHKCLDNGEFIDITTGAPIAGVVKFYELEKLLTFNNAVSASDQRLAKNPNNRIFVQNFEKRTKKFAQPALDKCVEQADVVWDEYLDKAMLDIYYAQRAKVSEIKQGCFDFVSSCYMNGDAALTSAMRELIGESTTLLQPDKLALSSQLCRDYVQSCNNMFDDDIIAKYIENRHDTDTLTACRAIAQQCFDKFGGTNYENFYYPFSGLFDYDKHNAPDWFTLYEIDADGNKTIKSECAKQLAKIDSCKDPDMLVKAFGGLDSITGARGYTDGKKTDAVYYYDDFTGKNVNTMIVYGLDSGDTKEVFDTNGNTLGRHPYYNYRLLRPTGVATEMYNQIIDILSTQCKNINGRFVELQFVKHGLYDENNLCLATFDSFPASPYINLKPVYSIGKNENMCPRYYGLNVDIPSWGVCLCWENGGRRSKWGKSPICTAGLPIAPSIGTNGEKVHSNDSTCPPIMSAYGAGQTITEDYDIADWCIKTPTKRNQVCPPETQEDDDGYCVDTTGTRIQNLPEGI